MKTGPRFLSLYASLLVVLAVSCTSHQRRVARSGEETAKLGAGAAAATVRPGSVLVDSELVREDARLQAARTQTLSKAEDGGVIVTFHAINMVETAPVSSLPEAANTQGQPGVELNELNDVQVKQSMPGPGPTGSSAHASSIPALPPSPGPDFSFEGNFVGNSAPPDTNGAIGPKHYVQYTNVQVGVYNRFTHTLIGTRFLLSSLFAPLGGVCAATNNGDPIVLYDKLADRWLLSQFGFLNQFASPYHECVAISKTPDPTGAYYAYDFQLPGDEFPDYPKFGTWPDAYYMTTNQFFLGGSFDGGGVFAFDRSKMLVGDPTAGGLYGNLNLATHPEGIFGMLPSDFDGLTPPPAGEANVFAYPTATTFFDPADGVRLFDFKVGVPFGTGATFTERPESSYAIPVPVTAWDLRDPPGRGDIAQPPPAGNNSTDRLDAVASRLMYRMQYYNHAGTEKLVTNITVNTSGVAPNNAANYRASVRYLELQRTGGAYSVNEQGTQSPTADGRWMGSAAEDNSADIAVGYSISSTTVHPSLAYAARVPGDPAGTLEGEQTLFAGTGVQRGTSNRWGDYSAMQLDPLDFCTFWFTSEYYTSTNLTFNWQTRIGAFHFPTCVSPAMGKLAGTVTYCQNGQPIKGAVITVSDGHGSATIFDGTYSVNLPPGSYTATATDPFANCATSPSQNFTITNGVTTPANFCLTGTPLIDLAGASFDDSAGNNNGVINRDECVKVNPTLQNDGCFSENGISAVLSTSTPGVVVDQPFSTYPNLAINASAVNDTPYRIHTTPSFVCGTPIVFTLNETGSLGGARVFSFSFPSCSAPVNFSGSLATGDLQQTARMGRIAPPSSCGSAKACPGPLGAGPRLYDLLPFANTSPLTVCLKIDLTADCDPAAFPIMAAAYLDSFDPSNLCTNYLGDPGGSPNPSGSLSVNIPPGHTLLLNVHEINPGLLGCSGYHGTVTGLIDNSDAGAGHLDDLSPAHEWIGLKNSDDVGTNFDLLAEVFRNGTLVGSGEKDGVSGGSSGFNNAKDRAVDLALASAGTDPACSGDTLSIKLSVRISEIVKGHRSGTARLWYNDSQAKSRFDVTIGGVTTDLYLLDGFVLGTSPGVGKKTIDVFVDRLVGGNAFKPFGTWIKTF